MVRLSQEMLPGDIALEKLFRIKVFTVLGFVRYDSVKLAAVLGKNYQEICAMKKDLIKKFSSPIVNGMTLYARAKNRVTYLPTLVPWLDSLLKAAFRSNSILEICGPPGCGKTQICWNVAVNMMVELKMKIFYIDTKGDFSSERLWSLLHTKYPEKSKAWYLSKMSVATVTDIYNLISTVDKLHETFEDEAKKHQVLIIDSISAVPYLGSIKNSGISLMSHLGASLKRLAVEKNVGVILTNLAIEEFQDKSETGQPTKAGMTDSALNLKPSGDRSYWMHAPHHRIMVTREREALSTGLIARIIKSDRLPIGYSQRFTINEHGIIC